MEPIERGIKDRTFKHYTYKELRVSWISNCRCPIEMEHNTRVTQSPQFGRLGAASSDALFLQLLSARRAFSSPPRPIPCRVWNHTRCTQRLQGPLSVVRPEQPERGENFATLVNYVPVPHLFLGTQGIRSLFCRSKIFLLRYILDILDIVHDHNIDRYPKP